MSRIADCARSSRRLVSSHLADRDDLSEQVYRVGEAEVRPVDDLGAEHRCGFWRTFR